MFVCRGNENSGAECTVVDDKTVEYKGKKYCPSLYFSISFNFI